MEKPLKIISEIKTPRLTARPAATAMADGLFHAIDISRERLREFLFWVDNVQKVEDERKTLSDFAEGWEKAKSSHMFCIIQMKKSSVPLTFTTFHTAIILPSLAIG